ncbi:DNA repair and recombination protein RadA [Candidatus Woesearchaeota archaeon]|nr:DNA repair and recombination protein RadA [Candidatus Woesearchaeota archaeon]
MAKDEENFEEEDIEEVEETDDDVQDNVELGDVQKPTLSDLPGVGAATVEKLEAAGFTDFLGVAVASPADLAEKVGMTPSGARKIIQAARSMLDMGFTSGDALLEKRKSVIKIKVPSEEINKLLDGGFETGAITEAFGQYGSSKTQIGHQLAVSCQQTGGKAVYIDTENTFRPERIIQMAKALGMDPDQALKNIKVARAYNSDHQMLLAEKVEELVRKDKDIRVVIVDSLTAHFRAEFIGRGTLADRQQKLNRHMHILSKLADSYNVCVFVTNQVMAKPDQFFGDPTEAIGGHIVGHNSTFRIYLRKGKKGSRVAKLVDSPNLPEAEAAFVITEDGVRDL